MNQLSKLALSFIIMTMLGFIVLLGQPPSQAAERRQTYQSIEFGYGVPIQLVDPSGLNQVQYSASYTNTSLQFTLYNVPVAEFARRYGKLSNNNYTTPPIDLTGLTQTATWSENSGANSSVEFTTLPKNVPSGIYVLSASFPNSKIQAMLYVVVSRHVLALKRGLNNQVVAWATNLQAQTPTPQMTITLYDAQGNALTQSQTNSDGLATLNPVTEPRLAVGQSGADLSMVGLDGGWRTDGGGTWWWDSVYTLPAYRVFLYTDRPIYRPGDTINFAAMLRRDNDGTFTRLEATKSVTLTLRDSRSNVVGSQLLSPDDMSSIKGSFTLATEPPLGAYQLELAIDNFFQAQSLQVEAYRKPEYQVDVTSPLKYVMAGDQISVTVAANYFFGQAVGQAAVNLKIYRQQYYYWWGSGKQLLSELKGTTDAQGQWTTTFTTDAKSSTNAQYSFVATVTDASNQPAEGSLALPVYWNDLTLNLSTDKYGYQAGENIVAQIQLFDHDTAPIAKQAVKVSVIKETYFYTQTVTNIVVQQSVTTNEQGQAQANLNSLKAGWYQLVAETTDRRGRALKQTRYLWIFSSGEDWWYTTSNDLTMTANRASYAVGEVAELLIQSRVKGVALLTLERGKVYSEQIVDLNGPVTTVKVPVTDSFSPNVFAKLQMFKIGDTSSYYSSKSEGKLVTAYAELAILAEDKRLQVKITPNSPQYQPGDKATFTLQVTDAAGQPVAAQVGLALVDEAIFALSADKTANLFETFYQARTNSVVLYDSLTPKRYLYVKTEVVTPQPLMTPSPSPAPTTKPDNGGDTFGGDQVRRKFMDTAYWNPDIRTNAQGQAEVTITLPDNLTTWRVVARAINLDTKVGESKANILVTKKIIARPSLPRFAILGDKFALNNVVQNFSGQTLIATVNLQAPSLVILDPGQRAVNLANLASTTANWTAVASKVGTNLVTCAVNTPNGNDAVELPLPIKPFAVPERWTAAGQANLVATETFTLPYNAIHDTSKLVIRLSPSVALGVLDGLDSLINYPYGCVEQTMSRVLPSAVAAHTYQQLGIPNPKAAELPEIISQGLTKLYGYQHADGSWGWWYDDDSNSYLTAYVLFGLTMVKEAGFEVNGTVLKNGFTVLDKQLSMDKPDYRTKAYALYVKAMAGQGNLAMAQKLVAQQDSLDPFARAALALALQKGGDTVAAQNLTNGLIAKVVETPTTAHWSADKSDYGYYWRSMSSDEKNTAMALHALSQLRPDAPLLPKVSRWLLEHRHGAGWNDTQATAFAVLGLVDYLKISGELQANYSYTVTLNQRAIYSGTVNSANLFKAITPITLTGAQLRSGENVVQIERQGNGQLYYAMTLQAELFYDNFTSVSSVDNGLSIQRTYLPVQGDKQRTTFNIGDLVEVHLAVNAKDEAWYVLLEDPLPAGFEGVSERVNTVSYSGGYDMMFWRDWGYNRKEIYDDHVTFFMTTLWPGPHTYTYMMRATTAGEFSVPPAQISPMYKDDLWGRSGSYRVTITSTKLVTRPTLAGDFDRDCRMTDFDLRQVAGAWGTWQANQDLNRNGIVDMPDVSVVSTKHGNTCLSTEPTLPITTSKRVTFTMVSEVKEVQAGQLVTVSVLLAGFDESSIENQKSKIENPKLAGFGASLAFNPSLLRLVKLSQNPALAEALSLGPNLENNRVAFGALNLATPLLAGTRLATMTFVAQSAGAVEFSQANIQAINEHGQTMESATTVTNALIHNGLYLPIIVKER